MYLADDALSIEQDTDIALIAGSWQWISFKRPGQMFIHREQRALLGLCDTFVSAFNILSSW